ncbi:hexameric tyrosine-coordinated heme protein [Oceanobacillus bengalensis]|uniref:Peroxidase n=1 Tax=Oceanobacillus bengalensis TaxID=1435466 RepID=A0A494YTB1_9BACI|nr:hexameric tyrosine-coordinated heme protein [Oceanobacillus bengalensis]RKQ13314.1 peroxidase [Oceanobacillus bengalensis]
MESWIKSLKTDTPQEGFELAIKLAQKGVEYTQPSVPVRKKLRPKYSKNADSLIAASQVISIHFQTVAAANNYWKSNFE